MSEMTVTLTIIIDRETKNVRWHTAGMEEPDDPELVYGAIRRILEMSRAMAIRSTGSIH